MAVNLEYFERYKEETLDGKIYLMSPAVPKHNNIMFKLAHVFQNYFDKKGCKKCVVECNGSKVILSEKDKVIPDVVVVCDKEKIGDDYIHGAPDFIAEVLSPSTAKRDRGYKKDLYEKHGVREYWLVSPKDAQVEVFVLKDGNLNVDEVYFLPTESWLKEADESERAECKTEITTAVFPELTVKLEDIFDF